MNRNLRALARELNLDAPGFERLRLSFGLACAERVRHLLEEPRALSALSVCRRYLEGACGREVLQSTAKDVADAARSHPGSWSIDGTGHAAVSATHAVAAALAGRAVDAAEYAAYASVYNYATHAVNDPESFQDEYAWQVSELRRQRDRQEPGRPVT